MATKTIGARLLLAQYMLREVMKIIEDCEEMQQSNESAYKKEQAKVSSYEEIRELLGKEETNGCRNENI